MSIKGALKKIVPGSLWNWLAQKYRDWRWRQAPLEDRFALFYDLNWWQSPESKSGPGSELEQTKVVRDELPGLLKRLQVQTLLDAPCGDFNWMKTVDLQETEYIGIDIVEKMIEHNNDRYAKENVSFIKKDITREGLPRADLIVCRDGLAHLSLREAKEALRRFKASGSTYLLTTTYPNTKVNRNIVSTDFHAINLEIPPFNLGRPMEVIAECPDLSPGDLGYDKHLGLWKLSDCKLS